MTSNDLLLAVRLLVRTAVGVMPLWTPEASRGLGQARRFIADRGRGASVVSMLMLWFSHGAAHTAPHHAAAILHHGLVCRDHPALS